jgi:hypothetical protein
VVQANHICASSNTYILTTDIDTSSSVVVTVIRTLHFTMSHQQYKLSTPANMPFSKAKPDAPNLTPAIDEGYDLVDYDSGLDNGDNEQLEREGYLLQQDQPGYGPFQPKKPYRPMISSLMNKEEPGQNQVPTATRSLVSHDIVTTLSPEFANEFSSQSERPPEQAALPHNQTLTTV